MKITKMQKICLAGLFFMNLCIVLLFKELGERAHTFLSWSSVIMNLLGVAFCLAFAKNNRERQLSAN